MARPPDPEGERAIESKHFSYEVISYEAENLIKPIENKQFPTSRKANSWTANRYPPSEPLLRKEMERANIDTANGCDLFARLPNRH